ncbi:MAG: hypothetical protein HOP15_08320 [Planctomycetes bacterium]|nr:hypothetical protein [Planctomycetota bacterium]
MKLSRVRVVGLCAFLVAAFGVRSALGILGRPTSWPIDRMLLNVGRYVEKHPEAAEAHYCLGRIHTYAFVHEIAQLAIYSFGTRMESLPEELEAGRMTLDELAQLVVGNQRWAGQVSRHVPEVQIEHLVEGLRSLRRALELAPARGAFHLTMAYALERGSHLASQVDAEQVFALEPPEELDDTSCQFYERLVRELGQPDKAEKALEALLEPTKLQRALAFLNRERASSDVRRQENVAHLLARAWLDQAIEHYRLAFVLAYEPDRSEELVHDYWGLTSLEAGEAYLRLSAGRPGLEPDEAFRARVSTAVAELRQKPFVSSVTPILLSLKGCRMLDDLIAPGDAVLFDVDGDLVEEPWPWLGSEAGWLVWDPKHTGVITSGRQLFGTASGWFFFPDGYRVLDALDDDRSGELRGAELMGIAVWFDRDSDGVSDRGEVVSVEALGIVALATEATERIGLSLGNPCGLELADGRVLPTYDWVLAPQAP